MFLEEAFWAFTELDSPLMIGTCLQHDIFERRLLPGTLERGTAVLVATHDHRSLDVFDQNPGHFEDFSRSMSS
jgi:hypothetical protein